jgi:hypothetical protein
MSPRVSQASPLQVSARGSDELQLQLRRSQEYAYTARRGQCSAPGWAGESILFIADVRAEQDESESKSSEPVAGFCKGLLRGASISASPPAGFCDR